MRIKIVPSLAQPVGQHWKLAQSKYVAHGKFYVAAPLSSTPLPVYDWIIKNAGQFPKWEDVNFVLMDEQVDGEPPHCSYIAPDDAASYESFAHRHFIDDLYKRSGIELPVIKPSLTQIAIFQTPINLLILALGVRGNFANVMPGTSLSEGWHVTELTDEFKQVHTGSDSPSYAGATFRSYGMSLGPQQVLAADEVIVIISGNRKQGLYRELLEHTDFKPEFPLSVIHHPDITDRVTLYATTDVAA